MSNDMVKEGVTVRLSAGGTVLILIQLIVRYTTRL